jgi:transposase-like protein
MDKTTINEFKNVRQRERYTLARKHEIIRAYLKGGQTQSEVWYEHTGKKDHGLILKWMRILGYVTHKSESTHTLAMVAKQKEYSEAAGESFETLQLKKRIAELELALKEAEMKAIAYSTMVDIAEKVYNIPIKKKFTTKPSK